MVVSVYSGVSHRKVYGNVNVEETVYGMLCVKIGKGCELMGDGDSGSAVHAESYCVCVCVLRAVGVPSCVGGCIGACCEAFSWPQRERENPEKSQFRPVPGSPGNAPL